MSGALAKQRMAGLGLWGRSLGKPERVVRHLTAMQAQEHAYARWSVGQRSTATGAEVDAAFDDGRFLRTHVLRPTWHYVAREDLRWLMALSGPIVHAGNARRYGELGLDARTLKKATDVIASAVTGDALTRRDVAAALAHAGIATDGQRMPYLLMHAELHAAICSGPMRGKQHTYAAFDERVPPASGPAGDEALAELARRYFTTRGPATVKDFGWWSGLRAADARRALAAVDGELDSWVDDGRTYWSAGGGGGRARRSSKAPKADLVQCYDEVIISYTESRDALVGEVAFPVPGRVEGFTHVVLLDGHLLGHWRTVRGRGGTAVETHIRPRLDDAERAAVDAAIERYVAFEAAHGVA